MYLIKLPSIRLLASRAIVHTLHSDLTIRKIRSSTDKSCRQLVIQQAPDLVSGLFLDINEAVDKLGSVLNKATNSLGCPKLNNISKSAFEDYPGLTKE